MLHWRLSSRTPLQSVAFLVLASACTLCAQPPAITQEGVRNAASHIPPSLPGGALAPGALFTIDGLRLAAAGVRTRVRLMEGKLAMEATVLSAGAERIEARVPMEARAGSAQLMVIRGDESSRAFDLRIAPSAFGIFTRNGAGWGPGEITDASGAGNTPATPARPGSILTLLGTGWGAARTAEIYAGGRRARFLSRSPHAQDQGTDEIRFQLPLDTPPGCYVPLVVKASATVSNVATIAVAPAVRPCPAAARADALVLLARVHIHARLNGGNPVGFPEEIGAAVFPANRPGAPLSAWELLPPAGTCAALTGRRTGDSAAPGGGDFRPFAARPGRDAGPRLTITGPHGAAALSRSPRAPDLYLASLGGGLPLRATKPPFLDPGHYTVTGPGGKDLGPFQAEADFGSRLEWLQPWRLDRIDRARGAAVEWRGATPNERVLVAAVSVDALSRATGAALCVAPGMAGHVRLPPLLLANLPATRNVPGVPQSYLVVAALPAGTPPSFHARGIQTGILLAVEAYARTVQFR